MYGLKFFEKVGWAYQKIPSIFKDTDVPTVTPTFSPAFTLRWFMRQR